MALRIRFQYPSGANLAYSIERLADGQFYDFTTSQFAARCDCMTAPLPEDQGIFLGRYKTTLASTPASVFNDGNYTVSIHDLAKSNLVVAQLGAIMTSGEDVTPPSIASRFSALLDPGFESPVVGRGNFQYAPTGSAWTFDNSSGLSGNASGFTNQNPAAPEGGQLAFIQSTGSFKQVVGNWPTGTYILAFKAAQRAEVNSKALDFQVKVDEQVVGTFTPSGSKFNDYYTSPFSLPQGNHTISFTGINSGKGDNTALIDLVRVVSL